MPLFSRGERSGNGLKLTPKKEKQIEPERPKRFLVLGSVGHGKFVDCYAWDDLPKGLNVADYDVVILNFTSFEEDPVLAEGIQTDLLPSEDDFARLLFVPGGEIIAIGRPDCEIGPKLDPDGHPFSQRARVDYWLPCWLGIEEKSGESIDLMNPEWQEYFEDVPRWNWFFTGVQQKFPDPTNYLRPVAPDANWISYVSSPIAQTRFKKSIAFSLRFRAENIYRYNPPEGPGSLDGLFEGSETISEGSPLFWLPTPEKVTGVEAIDKLLQSRFSLEAEARVPEWVSGYSLPAEQPIREEIDSLEQESVELAERLAEAQRRSVAAAVPRKLLYEQGTPLEAVVFRALREIGANVIDPPTKGIEDGLMECSAGKAILEIKGRRGAIKLADVRQIAQWASDAQLREGVERKPVIVGNPYRNTPVNQRQEVLASNARQSAINGGVAVLTTVQLFEAVVRSQNGELDVDEFWQIVLGSDGPVSWPSRT